MKKNYSKKIKLIKALSKLDQEKITSIEINTEAAKIGLTKTSATKAWKNFLETGGKVDLSIKNPNNPSLPQFGTPEKNTAKKRVVSSKDAGKIIKEWIRTKTRKVSINKFCESKNISTAQYYEWIHEINVSGKLLGRVVLDPTKYAKLNIKDLIWLKKFPHTKRKSLKYLDELEKEAYDRCYTVLVHRL